MRELFAIFLGVVLAGGLIYGAFTLYTDTATQVSAATTIEQVQEMGAKLAARYKTRATAYGTTAGTAIGDRTMVAFSMAASGMAVTGTGATTRLVSEWKTDVAVTGQQTYVTIEIEDVPGEACRAILSSLEAGSGVSSVKAGSGAAKTVPWSDADIYASTACGEGDAAVDMVFHTGHL